MAMNKEQILGMNDLAREEVYVPQWKDTVIVQEMTALERVRFEESLEENDPLLRVKLVTFSVVDENGERIFSPGDVQALARKNYKAIRLLSDAALRLSQVGQAELEEAAGNFPESQDGG